MTRQASGKGLNWLTQNVVKSIRRTGKVYSTEVTGVQRLPLTTICNTLPPSCAMLAHRIYTLTSDASDALPSF